MPLHRPSPGDGPDPKLLTARAQIEAICKAHDIGASVVLHNQPGQFEMFHCLEPSYSIIRSPEPGAFRFLSKLADYNGNVNKQLADQAATANMLDGMVELLAQQFKNLAYLNTVLDDQVHAEHTPMAKMNDAPTR